MDGAVIVTSAGGQATTGPDGRFLLALDFPVGAESLQVTAVASSGTGTLVASALVADLVRSAITDVPPLFLAQTTGCEPGWLPAFGTLPGSNGAIDVFTVYNDGSGPALYAGGSFTIIGSVGASLVAKWDGATWSPLGAGLPFAVGSVRAMVGFDDGSGPALYAGGDNTIAKWDGTHWSGVGSVSTGFPGSVYALAVFDDGSGPALYSGGYFTSMGGTSVSTIAKWDGSSWSSLGSGLGGGVTRADALTVFDDGGGPALYVGGVFTSAGSTSAGNVAKWDGTTWSALGSGIAGEVAALVVHDDGTSGGPALYAGGSFASAGGVPASGVAAWDGSSWASLGSAPGPAVVRALAVFDDGGGPVLVAGGDFATVDGLTTNDIATWNGTSWAALSGGLGASGYGVVALAAFDDGGGSTLYVGGSFQTASGVPASNLARWDGSSWLQEDGIGLNGTVSALTTFDDGGGPALYVGGVFTTAGQTIVNCIAKWDGLSWSSLGTGMADSSFAQLGVYALTVFDDGTGPALIAGGDFKTAGGVAANRIAKWNGSTWAPLGTGTSHPVEALIGFDDGTGGGTALFAGGAFTQAGGMPASCIAKWNGSTWSALGSGIGGLGAGGLEPDVHALAVFDAPGPAGPALYVAGNFHLAGGLPAVEIAKWNGATWSGVGGGMDGSLEVVYALTVADGIGGSGPALYAGGSFQTAGGVQVHNIAKWNGLTWSALGDGVSGSFAYVRALAAFDDGSGPGLIAGGGFTTAGGVAANQIAKWNGSEWSALGSGIGWIVQAMTTATADVTRVPVLYAGGSFPMALGSGDSFLACWSGCMPPPAVWTNLGSGLGGVLGTPSLAGLGSLEVGSEGSLKLSQAAPLSPAMLFASLSSTPAPFKCGTLAPVPVAWTIVLATSEHGAIPLAWSAWPAGLSGLSLYFQYAILDALAPCGVSLSNALLADVP